jgi:hypothetical protein
MFGRVRQRGFVFLYKSSNYCLLTVMDFQGSTALWLCWVRS